ncbi:MAG: hypothetical protein BV456_01700 [Thermoplasmata archaeon M8B2D]|nr:MAG: hypothetical protein BV456_01700 [Thermoplasmata archaeon M8B2D]
MLKILTNNSSFPSAKTLRDCLQDYYNKRIFVTSRPEKINSYPFIRYGNSNAVKIREETGFNSPNFIQLSSNKLKFSRVMERNEIYSPVYHRNVGELIFPLLIRETLTSFGCRGIHVIKNEEEFNERWRDYFYWTPYINLSIELRVHILGNKIVKIFKKELNEPQEFPIRNNSLCHFSLKSLEKYPKLDSFIETLVKIQEVNEGKFYSIDIGWDAIDKKYFVLEFNTGSGLNENTAEEYAKYIYENMEI